MRKNKKNNTGKTYVYGKYKKVRGIHFNLLKGRLYVSDSKSSLQSKVLMNSVQQGFAKSWWGTSQVFINSSYQTIKIKFTA